MITNNKLVILDRDGVINLDSDNYVKSPDEWIPINSSLQAIAKLNLAGFKVAVATNQSGIARGYFDQVTLTLMHKKMELALAEHGAHIDALEFCPDHPDTAGPNRKPNPGMALKLLELFQANPADTWFIGDSMSDVNCALNAGCKPALVKTGKGERTIAKGGLPENLPIFENLADFVSQLIR
ncbi:D-glycero-beta-D-manno-heptose 1,7-bisphosphate 7-phosphatase [Aliikangiella marina]|uniref:D,D-heptose 1,7-bisphosphate phosphatase n=1 Tax=Aliikangiella marina TaxID=1712262 RepID=A0A545T492_9GAMM|nr:D-glycero-beta-D-manno-heptose 1,7-bisphosphate 7-phosphatase [Aliikangiella marina]TQV71978.1 D-glycero-beta-D-manno-heptose 1,7-bisphosphate 7-phosphatase [Aliikangiella marina]TQV72031.1 D-glycero-beta-D-manno-heptose 1,7-bisphosphate 7-phosphatase [Aliikangiella marina]